MRESLKYLILATEAPAYPCMTSPFILDDKEHIDTSVAAEADGRNDAKTSDVEIILSSHRTQHSLEVPAESKTRVS